MFVVDYGTARRQKPRRRYWWGAIGFAMGLWLGVGAAHLFASIKLQDVSAAALGMGSALAAKGDIGRGGGS